MAVHPNVRVTFLTAEGHRVCEQVDINPAMRLHAFLWWASHFSGIGESVLDVVDNDGQVMKPTSCSLPYGCTVHQYLLKRGCWTRASENNIQLQMVVTVLRRPGPELPAERCSHCDRRRLRP